MQRLKATIIQFWKVILIVILVIAVLIGLEIYFMFYRVNPAQQAVQLPFHGDDSTEAGLQETVTWWDLAYKESASKTLTSKECGPMDINGDGKLDQTDLLNIKANYLQNCSNKDIANYGICGSLDTDNNGIINDKELYFFFKTVNKGSCAAMLGSITPTPSLPS